MTTKVHKLPAEWSEWNETPWPVAHEISSMLPDNSWTLVGGLMVRLRALIHGVPPNRATTDVDATVTLLQDGGVTYQKLADRLQEAGFRVIQNGKFVYRFKRVSAGQTDIVDLMFPDGVPSRTIPLLKGSPVFSVPGGRRAVSKRELVVLQSGESEIYPLYVPSLRDSLVIKGAAYIADSRDRDRHLSDAITLLACVEQPSELREGLSMVSRKRIRALLRGLKSNREVWAFAHPVSRDLAEIVLEEMNARFDVSGTVTPQQAARLYGNDTS